MHCLAEVQHPTLTHWHIIVRLRRPSHWLGGATGPVAAQEKAGRGHQQSACGILPEGVEDPSEGELGHYNEFRLGLGDTHCQVSEPTPPPHLTPFVRHGGTYWYHQVAYGCRTHSP